MNTNRQLKTTLALVAVLALGACGSTQGPTGTPGPGTSYPTSSGATNVYYGVVQMIEQVRLENTGIGPGAIVGAVVGGIVGNQIGKGGGNTAATVLGAAGGAYAGHQLEKRSAQTSDAYRVTVRMADGSYQSVTQSAGDDIRVGDRVQLVNGVAQRY